MKKSLFLLFALWLSVAGFAQISVKEGSFREAGQFFTMKDDMTDDNYTPFAVIRIKTENMTEAQVEKIGLSGNAMTYIDMEFHGTEVWVYLTYHAPYLKITHPDLSSTEFTIPYDMKPLHGYEFVLVNGAVARTGGGKGVLAITTIPPGATVFLNGKKIGQNTPYFNDMIVAGQYEITLEKTGFDKVTKTVNVYDGATICLDIEMPYTANTINIQTEPSGATVLVDNVERGITPLSLADVRIGRHELKIKKEHYLTHTSSFDWEGGAAMVINETLEKGYDGAIRAEFSISPTQKVFFSKGNLQYRASTNTWRFAEHPWDYVGVGNAKISKNYNGWMDLFGWGTGSNPTLNSYGVDKYKRYTEWGKNAISNGGNIENLWRTPTRYEWEYVFDLRETESGIRFAMAVVNGVHGIILLPDSWDKKYYKLKKVNEYCSHCETNKISIDDWTNKLEAHGAVFLPAAGHRTGDWHNIFNINDVGYYWTAPISEEAYRVADDYAMSINEFATKKIVLKRYGHDYGFSVRLVCPCF